METTASHPALESLAKQLVLADLLVMLEEKFGGYQLLAHWTQGEFHHDLVLRVEHEVLPGSHLVVSTNCNGGIKEVLALAHCPERWALWNHRCPNNPEFDGEPPCIAGVARTVHWFDPCALLADDARSELKPEHRERQRGGGWKKKQE
ncbi:MAG: hypothetical protein ACQEVA_01260 [Myxococcota bacterium]